MARPSGAIEGELGKRKPLEIQGFFALPGLDSNQDKENQNLLCYRYTTG
jgi:hypothetical protein